MKLFMLTETGTVDTLSAWLRAAQDKVSRGDETSVDALLGRLVPVRFVDGDWIHTTTNEKVMKND